MENDDMDEIDPKDRRVVSRRPGNTIKPLRLRFAEGEIVAIVRDISVTGIGILTRQPLEAGTWLVLESGEQGRQLSPELRAEVRHTRQHAAEEYLIGCHFSRHLTIDDVTVLG